MVVTLTNGYAGAILPIPTTTDFSSLVATGDILQIEVHIKYFNIFETMTRLAFCSSYA